MQNLLILPCQLRRGVTAFGREEGGEREEDDDGDVVNVGVGDRRTTNGGE